MNQERFVIDGKRMTCAGGAAAIDMMLAWIAQIHGKGLAVQVADQLVHFRGVGEARAPALMAEQVPANAVWAAFGIGRNQFPMVATAVTLGGHVRVGLEDNLYLSKGVYASNGTLTERAVTIIEALGSKVASPDDARALLNLKKK